MIKMVVIMICIIFIFATGSIGAKQKGIAALYPGDEGIEEHESIVFTEKFESDTLSEVIQNWTWSRGDEDHRLSLDSEIKGPAGTTGNNSLKMTVLRDKPGSSGDLRLILDEGYEELYLRFYVKFANDYGYNHHFTRMRGEINPTKFMKGRAGERPEDSFSSAIEPSDRKTLPGNWRFYTYWPQMRSWQTFRGEPDPNNPSPAFYGNSFIPEETVSAKRGEWQCVEMMIRLNSAPDKKDGAQSFWIDGKLVGNWDPTKDTKGYWIKDKFYSNPDHYSADDFEGINWRPVDDQDKFEKLKINIIQLHHYVSDRVWEQVDEFAEENPEVNINSKEATVWKDHVVVATEYIGPIEHSK